MNKCLYIKVVLILFIKVYVLHAFPMFFHEILRSKQATLKFWPVLYIYTVEPPITDHPRDRQPPYNRQSLWHGLKSLLHIILSQPPRNGRFSIPESGKNWRSLTAFSMQNCLHNEHHGSCPHKINPLSARALRAMSLQTRIQRSRVKTASGSRCSTIRCSVAELPRK